MIVAPRSRLSVGLSAMSLAVGALVIGIAPAPPVSAAVSPTAPVVINEVYGGGGNSGGLYRRDFVELYNTTSIAQPLAGWTVQYANATGSSWQTTVLTGDIAPGATFIVGEAFGSDLNQPDVVVDINGTIPLAGSGGKVALVNSTTALTCGTGCAALATVVDFLGWGSSATSFAGLGPAAGTANSTASSRNATHTNTADNSADFTSVSPTAPTPLVVLPDVGNKTIAEIQGTGFASPFVNNTATTTGVVTAVYPSGGLGGYVIQTAGSGSGTATGRAGSEGLFIASPSTVGSVAIGDAVQVFGAVTESFGLTMLTVADANGLVDLATATAPTPIVDVWPATTAARESIESMLYQPAGTYTVANTFGTNQYGEVGLATGTTPLLQPTDVADFGSPQEAAVAVDNAARGFTLDDGSTVDFLAASSLTPPYIAVTDPLRVGATPTFVGSYIVDYRNGLWKIQPPTTVTNSTPPAQRTTFSNTRSATPDTSKLGDGNMTVASFNVLNYFTTLGTATPTCTSFKDRTGAGVTVSGGCDQRGAWDTAAFGRQQVKIVNAIDALDAAVVGLMEIENSARLGESPDEAVSTLVAALNAAVGSTKWAFVPSSSDLPVASGQDVINNAIIYQPAKVTPLGGSRALGNQSGTGQPFSNAREPIGQAFTPIDGGIPFFVAVNHFKSKSASGASGVEADTGQGAFNASRVAQATALRDWIPTVLATYTATPVDAVFLLGDFNSYTQEDPLQVLYAAGFTDANTPGPGTEYSYSFGGLSGSLDHVLFNAAVAPMVTGHDIWNINSPESIALEYSRYNYHGTIFYDETPFRSSDHDPVIVAFDTAPHSDMPDYNPVGPLRVFDTRPGQSPGAIRTVAKAKVSGDPGLSVQFTDLAGAVPNAGVGAVSINVTVAGADVPGFVTVWSCGARQVISSVNFGAGQTVANSVVTPVSDAGSVCFFSNTPVDIIVDINGWFAAGQSFSSVGPARVFDTRTGQSPDAVRDVTKQKISGDTTLRVKFTGLSGLVPVDGVGTVSINVTVTGATADGFVTVYPCGQRGEVSSVNFAAGQTVANAVISRVSASGEVCFYSNTPVDVIADVNGWFPTDGDFTSIDPTRLFDTRPGQSINALRDVPKTKVGGATVLEVKPIGLSGLVPIDGISAVSMNVTVIGATVDGFVTVYPCGTTPTTSSVNFVAGQTVANAVITPLSATSTVCFFSNTAVDIVADVNGYFDAPVPAT